MWIFTFAPEWVFHTLFAVGAVATLIGFVLGTMPFIKKYALGLKILGVTVLSLAVYLEGGLNDYREWEFKANELQAKISKMETEMAKEDVKIVEKVVNKTQVVREKGKEVIVYVDREVTKYDSECKIPGVFVDAHNQAAEKAK